MSFPRYPEYKDSGVGWLGEVPAHWEMTPLKHLAEFVNGDAFKPADWAESGIPIIRIQNLNGGDEFNYFDGKVEERYLVREGDLLFGWSGNRGTSFGPFVWRKEGIHALNQHIFRVVPFLIDKNDLYWVLKAVTAHVEDQAHGIIGMVHVTKGDLGSIKVPVPTPEEQTAIATFLGRETAKIDALVAEQEKLMALLKEKRQAVISHAVTKGLDPNVPMKDSGVEWLGDVPAHWSVHPLKYLVRMQSGGTPSKANPEFWGGVIPWASAKDMKVDILERTQHHITEFALACSAASLVPMEALVVVVRGMILAHTFPVAQLAGPLSINQDLKALIPCHEITSDFLAWTLRGLARETLDRVSEAGHGTCALRMEDWVSMTLPVPPVQEQVEIVRQLVCTLKRLGDLVVESQGAIGLLQERRAALISAAVTGKIDVRGLTKAKAA